MAEFCHGLWFWLVMVPIQVASVLFLLGPIGRLTLRGWTNILGGACAVGSCSKVGFHGPNTRHGWDFNQFVYQTQCGENRFSSGRVQHLNGSCITNQIVTYYNRRAMNVNPQYDPPNMSKFQTVYKWLTIWGCDPLGQKAKEGISALTVNASPDCCQKQFAPWTVEPTTVWIMRWHWEGPAWTLPCGQAKRRSKLWHLPVLWKERAQAPLPRWTFEWELCPAALVHLVTPTTPRKTARENKAAAGRPIYCLKRLLYHELATTMAAI